jgi:mono/diheme cytochrome c family protein
MRRALPFVSVVPLALALLVAACGGGKSDAAPAGQAAAPAAGGDLTPFELEHGIGPITEPVQLAPVDDEKSEELAEAGEKVFAMKCSACHKMQDKYVGPPLGDVTLRRSPAFIMNQILNPEAMYNRHPEVRKLLAEYMTQMPNQGLTQDEARQIVEYLRTQAPGKAGN